MKFKTALPDNGQVYAVTLIDGDGRPFTHTIFATPSNDAVADTRLWILGECETRNIFHAYIRVIEARYEYDETYFFDLRDTVDLDLVLRVASR